MGHDQADEPLRELEWQLATEDPELASALSDVRKPNRLAQKRRLRTVAWAAVILLAVPSTIFAGVGMAFLCGLLGGVL